MVVREIINSEKLNGEREIFIYLPPNYDEDESQFFPCLYMQDGQNLFSEMGDSPYGKWNVDLTAETLIAEEKIEPLIIVGVANSEWRDYEYTPTYDESEECGGYADIYLEFMTEELIPFINEKYRVLLDREFTSICGSSLGGLLSIYALINYSDVFSSAAALSPSIWWDNKYILGYADNCDFNSEDLRLWVDMGWYEDAETDDDEDTEEENNNVESVDDTRDLYEILIEKGFEEGENFIYYEDTEGFHNEVSWAERMEMVLQFLYPINEIST